MQRITVFSPHQGILRRMILFGTPILMIGLELGHPLLDHAHPIKMLAPIALWWIALHVLLIPLFAIMGYSLFLLLQGVQSMAATISRFATVSFVAFEVGYDTAIGLNSGILVYNATTLPPVQQNVVQQALQQLYGNPSIVVIYYIFFVAGVVAISSAAWALYHVGVPRSAVIVLLGTVISVYSHALPFGPIGTACFLIAVLWIELAWRQSTNSGRDSLATNPVHIATE